MARGIFLANSHGRRDPRHFVHVRLLDALQKLARVGRKGLNVAPLALGVDRIECEARFPGARNARDHGELVKWNLAINVLEVVDARAAHFDGRNDQTSLRPPRNRGCDDACFADVRHNTASRLRGSLAR